jgi:biopolymer transport protein TolR
MGGGGMPQQGGKHGKKTLDAVINVVPAIDLLSCCITFLLYTAVWTQISRLQVQQFGSGAPEPPAGEQQKALIVNLEIGERSMHLTTTAGQEWNIPVQRVAKLGGGPDDKVLDLKELVDYLKVIRTANPDAAAVTISMEDVTPYGDLIQVIDTCVGQGLVSVSVAGG